MTPDEAQRALETALAARIVEAALPQYRPEVREHYLPTLRETARREAAEEVGRLLPVLLALSREAQAVLLPGAASWGWEQGREAAVCEAARVRDAYLAQHYGLYADIARKIETAIRDLPAPGSPS